MLHEPQPNAEQVTVQRYVDLCKVALKAKNYPEVIQYCNRILELAPGNVEAWFDKGIATACLSTEAYDRSDEAVQYLRHATEADPGDAWLSHGVDALVMELQRGMHLASGLRGAFDGNSLFEYSVQLWRKWGEAAVNLPRLKIDLEKAEVTLARLRTEDGLHSGPSIQEAERQVDDLRELIAKGEMAANVMRAQTESPNLSTPQNGTSGTRYGT